MNRPGKVFEGKPCRKCGGRLRYISKNRCVTCTRIKRPMPAPKPKPKEKPRRVERVHVPAGRSRALDALRRSLHEATEPELKARLAAAVAHLERVVAGVAVKPRDPPRHDGSARLPELRWGTARPALSMEAD